MVYTLPDIEWMTRSRRLKLSPWQKFEHYIVVWLLCAISAYGAYWPISRFIDNGDLEGVVEELLTVALPFLVLAAIVLVYQKRRLNFRTIRIKYTDADFQEAVKRTSETLGWYLRSDRDGCFRAFRSAELGAGWAQMITIVREENTLHLNCINDLSKHVNILPFGGAKENIDTFLVNLAHTLQNIPASRWHEAREAKKWYAKKTVRYVAYGCCAGMIMLSIFLLLERQYKLAFSLIGFVWSYGYLDYTLMWEERDETRRRSSHSGKKIIGFRIINRSEIPLSPFHFPVRSK